MFKSFSVLLASAFCALSLQAQSEPQKTKPLGSTTPPPAVRDAAKPPAGKVPPVATPDAKTSSDTNTKAASEKNPPAFDLKNMDTSVKPQDDFYTYANGTWLKNNPIPPEESRWGSFNALLEKNNEALRVAAEKAAKAAADPNAAPAMQKVGDYYASGMDEKAINAAKAKPLADEFKRIDEIKDKDALLLSHRAPA